MAAASKQSHPPQGALEEQGPAPNWTRPGSPSDLKFYGPRRVELNPADCNLDFIVSRNGLQGHALHEEGFAYCWSGARATVGITGGKYCFGCKIVSEQQVQMSDTPPDQQHLCRTGVSRGDDSVGSLGETIHSFGFGGTGKFSNSGKFSAYGSKFGLGDTIICAVDLDSKPLASIGFSKNGEWLGNALQFDASAGGLGVVDIAQKDFPWASALFPHILLKNVVVQLMFSIDDGLIPQEGYKPWSSVLEDGNGVLGPSFSNPNECEVLMMVGLPASGKTTWAEKWVEKHPEKRYVILGTNLSLDQMKVPGLLRKQNYGERFDRLMVWATGIFNALLARASKIPRNYILDQTNVYKSARIRKLKPFIDYRKVAVVVFPSPNEMKVRTDKRYGEMGKEVPADAVNEMLANYVLPMSKDMHGSAELFDEVIFPELSHKEAQKHLLEMKQALGAPSPSAKGGLSQHSVDSSARLFSGPNKEAGLALVGHTTPVRSPAFLPDHAFKVPPQMGSTYSTPGSSYRAYQPMFHGRSPSCPSYGVYWNYSEHENLPRDEPRPSDSYGVTDPYARNTYERNPTPMGVRSLFRPYGVSENLRKSNFDIPPPLGRDSFGYPNTEPLYSAPGANIRIPEASQVNYQSTRQPPYQWNSPNQSTYGAGFPYAALPRSPPGPR